MGEEEECSVCVICPETSHGHERVSEYRESPWFSDEKMTKMYSVYMSEPLGDKICLYVIKTYKSHVSFVLSMAAYMLCMD